MPLDPTLSQVLSELYASHAELDRLRQRVQQLEEIRNEYDHELGERSRVNLELRDRIAELEAVAEARGLLLDGTMPPGWHFVKVEVPASG